MIKQCFFGVPLPEEAEAPSSWMIRAAASQGESLKNFASMLGFFDRRNFDEQFVNMAPRHIAQICGLPPYAFDLVHRLLYQAYQLRLKSPVLLTENRGKPRFRFCPICLKTQRTPYFPVQWRFDAWRMCYHHRCMMEDKCAHCGQPVLEPRDMLLVAHKKENRTFLSQCHRCLKLLWLVKPVLFDSEEAMLLEPLEKVQLLNGNAFLASLVHEVVQIPGMKTLSPNSGLKIAERRMLIASGDKLTADYVRELNNSCTQGAELERQRSEAFRKWLVEQSQNATRNKSNAGLDAKPVYADARQ